MHQWVKLKGCWCVFAWLLHRNRRCPLCLYNPIKLGRVLGGVWCDNYNWCHQQIWKICRFAGSVMVLADESFCHIWFILIYSKKRLMAKVIIKKAFTLQGSVYVQRGVRQISNHFISFLFVNVSFQWMCVEDIEHYYLCINYPKWWCNFGVITVVSPWVSLRLTLCAPAVFTVNPSLIFWRVFCCQLGRERVCDWKDI